MATQRGAADPTTQLPDFVAPMLAERVLEPFDSPEFLFEIKWDGTRCLAFVEEPRLRLVNRRKAEMAARYPELAGLRGLPAGTLLDAEVVVLEGGKPSFNRLAQREHIIEPERIAMRAQRLPATLVAFDVLYDAGANVMAEPLSDRRQRLRELIGRLKDPHVIASEHVVGHGRQYFAAAEQHGLEGVMAKRLASRYQPGKRSRDWLKIKVARVAVFDLLGYVPRAGSRVISALVVGVPADDGWVFRGKVGTGFNEAHRAALYELLVSRPQLANPPRDGPRDAVWCAPGLKARVRYFERTEAGHLRGPVFEGLVDET